MDMNLMSDTDIASAIMRSASAEILTEQNLEQVKIILIVRGHVTWLCDQRGALAW
jgi:hypothetical protein